jgi:hypothetical protein
MVIGRRWNDSVIGDEDFVTDKKSIFFFFTLRNIQTFASTDRKPTRKHKTV